MIHSDVHFLPFNVVDNQSAWYWIKSDQGAWYGPKQDWEIAHKDNILKYVPVRHNVIQAGGNLGMYPRLLSSMFEMVYTFEPDILNFYVLNLNCPQENIVRINAALGETSDMITVNRNHMSNVGMHTINTTTKGLIPQITLDSMSWKNPIDLIMFDIEGYEIYALRGAEKTILEHKPVIFLEAPNQIVLDYMKSLGYEKAGMSAADMIFTHITHKG
jgi:FkbM family methyltransferase